MNLDRTPLGWLGRLMRRMAFNLDGKHRKGSRKPTGIDKKQAPKGCAKPDGWKSLGKNRRRAARESRRRNRAT